MSQPHKLDFETFKNTPHNKYMLAHAMAIYKPYLLGKWRDSQNASELFWLQHQVALSMATDNVGELRDIVGTWVGPGEVYAIDIELGHR